MASSSRFEVEKFTGQNDFGLWKLKMKVVLMQQGVWDLLKGDAEKKEPKDEKEEAKMQERQYKAYSTLILGINDRVLREVSEEETAAGVWAKLESIYMTKSLANRLHLKQKLFTFKISESRSILEQLEEFGKCVDDLESVDEKIRDEDKALMLLNSLPGRYEQFKDAILLGRDSKVTYEEVYSTLRLKEVQKSITSKAPDPAPESLSVRAADKGNFKKKFQKKAKGVKDKPSQEKETRSCHYCQKPGHIKKNCFASKRKLAEEERGQHTTDCVQGMDVPTPAGVFNVMKDDDRSSWIMDSGCTFHLCPVREWFEEMRKGQGSVLLGNNQTCQIQGIGNIRLRLHDGSEKILTEVGFIPYIKRNRLSLGVLARKGYSFSISQDHMKVIKDGKIVMVAHQRNNLYYVQAQVVMGVINITQTLGMRQWHSRLGHLSESGMRELVKRNIIVLQDSHEQLQACEECILAKSKKLPYQKGMHVSAAPLDYAHSDLWGLQIQDPWEEAGI